ncbi:MAG: NUDIX domain-containing protein [Ruminococcus sp.]|nr:NUDIX domain-containing protein [Ruminococcus sp.]
MKISSTSFSIRSAAIITVENKLLLVQEGNKNFYYTVGGAVHIRESSEEAVIRETKEETGISYEINRLVMVEEWLPADMNIHQIVLYYLMKPNINTTALNNKHTDLSNETLKLIDMSEIKNYEIAPQILKEIDLTFPSGIIHFIRKSAAKP